MVTVCSLVASAFPDTATVIDNRTGESILTDSPFVESKEFIAGFWIVEAAEHAVALKLAAEGSRPAIGESSCAHYWVAIQDQVESIQQSRGAATGSARHARCAHDRTRAPPVMEA